MLSCIGWQASQFCSWYHLLHINEFVWEIRKLYFCLNGLFHYLFILKSGILKKLFPFVVRYCVLFLSGLIGLGISGPLVLSFIVFLCSFVPVVGVFISTLPMMVAALSDYGMSKVTYNSMAWLKTKGCLILTATMRVDAFIQIYTSRSLTSISHFPKQTLQFTQWVSHPNICLLMFLSMPHESLIAREKSVVCTTVSLRKTERFPALYEYYILNNAT